MADAAVATERPFVTVSKVARDLGKTTNTIYQWIRLGYVLAEEVGAVGAVRPSYRIPSKEVRRVTSNLSKGLPVYHGKPKS